MSWVLNEMRMPGNFGRWKRLLLGCCMLFFVVTATFPGGSDSLACVAYAHVGSALYQVSSAFDVVVTKSNSTSPNYRLAAEISTVPPANVTWLVNNIALTTTFTTLDAADNYSTAVTKTLQIQVKNTVPAQVLTETITFLATAN